ncbi:sensor histidine kinase [Streptomonospora salina]|uniref:Sensor-like histidine kinase SenX3 n=1 Tax=Streptomonospora salina TaxID=104205 RepID=A0A841E1F8_9ACTN|nr:ATP-binding protein [Streptomonospora salina]MBB5996965.1 signal transduction histidine kinase [Streptomonospora salina]
MDRLTETNQRSFALVDALLHLAEADGPAEHGPVDLAAIAHTAVAEQAAEAARSGVVVESLLEPARTAGNATLLAQVASNLVQNAVRHNPDEAGRVWVATGRGAAADRCVLRVENTGADHDGETVQRLREPFLRGAGRVSAGRTGPAGHGLGLALVDRIVLSHAGELGITSRSGSGLSVYATLPGE